MKARLREKQIGIREKEVHYLDGTGGWRQVTCEDKVPQKERKPGGEQRVPLPNGKWAAGEAMGPSRVISREELSEPRS